MADASFAQTSFLGGEVSLRVQGRFDMPAYRTWMNVCLNAFPTETGPWTRRPGTKFAATTRGGAPGRLFKLDFQASSPYTMEFTDGFLRFFNGAALVTTNDDQVIVAISSANPAVVQTTTATTWATGGSAIFNLLGTSCPLLQNRTFKLTKIDTTHFSLADAITGASIDGSTLGVGSLAAGATIAHVLEIATSYTAGAWASLRVAQAMSMTSVGVTIQTFLLHPTIVPFVLGITSLPTPSSFATFSLVATVLSDGPYMDPVTSGETLAMSAYGGSVTVTASGTSFGGFVPTDLRRHIRIFLEPPRFASAATYAAGDLVSWPTTTLTQAGAYWTRVTAGAGGAATPGTDPTIWAPAAPQPSVAHWVWGIIATYNSATSVLVTLQVVGPTYTINGVATDPTISLWRLGAFGDTNGWPSSATCHEGRLWLAGPIGNRVDASESNKIFSFAPTDPIGAVLASSAISYTFNSPDVNLVSSMTPDLQGIICVTKGGEWLVQAPTTGPISPTNIAARRVTKIRGANIEPVRTEHTVLFVQAFGRKVMEYFADIYSGKFAGPHLSFTWKHLTAGGIDEIAYQQELAPTLWMRVKGALMSCTYKRDTLTTAQGPTISAGARHTLGSGRAVESLSVGPSVGGNLDSLSMITNDPATSVRHVEILTDMLDEDVPSASAWYLDDAVRPTSTATTNVASGGAPYGGMTLNGLWHLNGKTVQVWAGGVDCGNPGDNKATFADFAVANGSVFVPYGDGVSSGSGAGLFTAAFAAAAAAAGTIVVGFTYNSDGQIVRPATPQESGARTGPALAKIRRSDKFGILVENTAGMQIGTSFSHLWPVLFKGADGNTTLPPNVTFSGIHRDVLGDDYSFDSMVCWRIARPYPASLVAMGSFLQTQDS